MKLPLLPPKIWSNIRLNFGSDKLLRGSRVNEAAFMLGVSLDRARPHDLNIVIQHDDDISAHLACAVLLPSVQYWKSLEVWGASSCDLGFLSPCRGFFTQLETAEVRGHYQCHASEPIDIFSTAPCLRSFTKSLNAPFSLPANLIKFRDSLP